ncbi:MAG: ABC transporter ATP-binding protein [Gammaproteobacteria bacterium HGW-Gammaproteobacteria-3]|nr:MAG: ABC transporter ATP-binding protein [Gammaproteobacteria bacterium HGW-Gammaproteobacteria-3]
MSKNCAISVERICTRFGDKLIHKDIDFCLETGEILALVGASGSGKTTLLREIIGLQIPDQGRIVVMGQIPDYSKDLSFGQLSHIFGVLFQKGALFSALTVFDNIAFPLRERGIKDNQLIAQLVALKLAQVGLAPNDALLMPAELSGGMIKRVALARALILEPKLLLLDEPTSGLDPIASQGFVDLLSELHHELAFTVVMVTHDLNVLHDLSTRVAVLADQQLVAYGPLAKVLSCPHPFVRQFFHNKNAEKIFMTQEAASG